MASPPTDYYVDPSIAANTGAGTVGDPYGDLQHCLDTITRDSTDGDRINVKAGTAESLSSSLSLSSYGSPIYTAPLIIQGYTTAQGDGGVAEIDCNAAAMFSSPPAYTYLIHLEIHDGPSTATMVNLGNGASAIGCEIHTSDGHGLSVISNVSGIIYNHFHDLGGSSYDMVNAADGVCIGNYFDAGANTPRYALVSDSQGNLVQNNIIYLPNGGATDGIYCSVNMWGARIINNTVLSIGGTGRGIFVGGNSVNYVGAYILNNYIEGFSGTGGDGIVGTTTSIGGGYYGHNAVFNCATAYNWTNEQVFNAGDNETLGATGLAKSGAITYANRHVYFAAADQGNMIDGGFPQQ